METREQRLSIGWRIVIAFLIVLVMVFAVRRMVVDVPNVLDGRAPDGPDHQYALHPALGYAHILLVVPYLLLAPLQLWRPFRTRHYDVHRRVGRVIAPLALVGTVAAVVFGVMFPVGGPAESVASVVFGAWLLVCLSRGWLAIRAGDPALHRRWMVRAFAVGLGVGTIRVWVGIFTATGVFDWYGRFAWGFPLAFTIHVVVGELWLRAHPQPVAADSP